MPRRKTETDGNVAQLKLKIKVSHYRIGQNLSDPWLRLPEVLDNRPYAPAAFTPQEISLALISVTGLSK